MVLWQGGQAIAARLAQAFVSISADIKPFMQQLGRVQSALNQQTQAFSRLSGTRLSATFLGLSGALGGLRGSISSTIEFERQLANAFALVKDITNEQRQAIRLLSLELSTKFGQSAASIAGAFKELASAGFSVQQQLGAMPEVLRFAAAAEVEAAEGAEILARALNAAGLATKNPQQQLANIITLGDKLARANEFSVGTIKEFVLALGRGGAAIDGFGASLNDTIAIIAAFNEIGIVSKRAGSATTQTIRNIADAFARHRQLFKTAFKFEAFDKDNQFIGAAEAIKKLADRLNSLDPLSKRNALNFAKLRVEGSDLILTIIKMAESIAELSRELDNSAGTLRRQAEERLIAVGIEIENVKNAFLALAFQILPGVIDGVNTLLKPLSLIVFRLTQVDIVTGGLLQSLIKAGAATATWATAFGLILPFLAKFLFKGIFGFGRLVANVLLVRPALLALAGALQLLSAFLVEAGKSLVSFGDGLFQLAIAIDDKLLEPLRRFGDALYTLTRTIPILGQVVRFASVGFDIFTGLITLAGVAAGKLISLIGGLLGITGKLAGFLGKVTSKVEQFTSAIIGMAAAAVVTPIIFLFDRIAKKITESAKVQEAWNRTMAAFEQAWQRILAALRLIGEHIGNELVRLFERLLALAERLVGVKLSAEMDETATGVDRIQNSFVRLLDRAAEFAELVAAAVQTAANRWDLFVDLVQKTVTFLAEWFKEKFSSVALDLKMKMETMFSGAIAGAKTLLGVLQSILAVASSVESAIKNAFTLSQRIKDESRVEDEVRKLVEAGHTETLETLRRVVRARIAAEQAGLAPIDEKALKLFSKLFTPLPDMLEKAGKDLKESANVFAEAIGNTILDNNVIPEINRRLGLDPNTTGEVFDPADAKAAGTGKFGAPEGFSGFLGFEELARKTQELAFGNDVGKNTEKLLGVAEEQLKTSMLQNDLLLRLVVGQAATAQAGSLLPASSFVGQGMLS